MIANFRQVRFSELLWRAFYVSIHKGNMKFKNVSHTHYLTWTFSNSRSQSKMHLFRSPFFTQVKEVMLMQYVYLEIYISYLVRVRPILMFSSIWCITESLGTARKFTSIRFFSCVRTQMSLQVFKSRVSLVAVFKLK